MTSVFAVTVIVYAAGLAALCAGCAVSGRPRPAAVTIGLAVVQLSLVVQALLDLVTMLRGDRPGQLATHIGYLLTSLVIVPVTVATVRLDPGRWGSAALAVGCVLVAVVSLRLHQTSGVVRA